MPNTTIKMTRNEIRKLAGLITETKYSSRYNCGKGKRLYNEMFTTLEERQTAQKIMTDCISWTLKSGIPAEITYTAFEYEMLLKLEKYCMALF